MKREIRFRGLRMDGKGFIYGNLEKCENFSGLVYYQIGYGKKYYRVIPESVGQYTGLKDKNGVDIYEGDIVRILYTDWPSKSDSDERTLEEYLCAISLIQVVVWEVNGFYVAKNIGEYTQSLEVGEYGGIEIIGNIHEHPELLLKQTNPSPYH